MPDRRLNQSGHDRADQLIHYTAQRLEPLQPAHRHRHTMRAGACTRTACTAANIEAPVANPSSTRITTQVLELHRRPRASVNLLATQKLPVSRATTASNALFQWG